MSITIVGADIEERIQRQLERGAFADASDVVAHALELLEDQEHDDELRTLVQEGLHQIERGESIRWTPQLMDQVMADATAANRRGAPIADHVKP